MDVLMKWIATPEFLLSLIAAAFLGIALSPLAERVKNQALQEPKREILAVVRARVADPARPTEVPTAFQAVKIETKRGLLIEIFRMEPNAGLSLVNSFDLPKASNGFFHINGEPASMAFLDQDGDGLVELVVSSYDSQLRPRLSVYAFDASSKKFQASLPTP